MQTRVAIAIMVLCISGSGYGQGINPDKAVRDLTSKQAGIQLKAQDDIFTSLGTPKHPSRGQMVSSIIEVATGPEVTEFGSRALAMMGIALERDPSAGDLVDAFERVYIDRRPLAACVMWPFITSSRTLIHLMRCKRFERSHASPSIRPIIEQWSG